MAGVDQATNICFLCKPLRQYVKALSHIKAISRNTKSAFGGNFSCGITLRLEEITKKLDVLLVGRGLH